jgi:hypothetical protein
MGWFCAEGACAWTASPAEGASAWTASPAKRVCLNGSSYQPRVCSSSFSSIAATASPFIDPVTCSAASDRIFGSL